MADYIDWLSPYLLTLPGLDEDTRRRLEASAVRHALVVDDLWRLYPQAPGPGSGGPGPGRGQAAAGECLSGRAGNGHEPAPPSARRRPSVPALRNPNEVPEPDRLPPRRPRGARHPARQPRHPGRAHHGGGAPLPGGVPRRPAGGGDAAPPVVADPARDHPAGPPGPLRPRLPGGLDRARLAPAGPVPAPGRCAARAAARARCRGRSTWNWGCAMATPPSPPPWRGSRPPTAGASWSCRSIPSTPPPPPPRPSTP